MEQVSPTVGRTQQRWILLLLATINTVNFGDRQILTILAEPIRLELGLADWHLGMLTGLAFALLYTIAGVPLARIADRSSRTKLISASLVTWSVFTAACAFVTNFTQLLIARIGVGVGEGGCTPAAHSLISDITPPNRRASAIAIYALGVPLGSLIGLSLGGIIASMVGWRTTFLIAGAPGILLAVIILFVREPRKGRPAAAEAPQVRLREALAEFWGKPAFRWLCAAAAAAAFVFYGQSAFYGALFLRTHHVELEYLANSWGVGSPLSVVGIVLGFAIGVGGGLGTWAGGILTERRLATDAGAYATVPGVATLISTPFFIAAAFASPFLLAGGFVFLAIFFQSMTYGPIFAGAQNLVSPRTRATASAILLFVLSAIGLGCGPLAIGLASDLIGTADAGHNLRWAMGLLAGAMLLAPLLFLKSHTSFQRDVYKG